MVTRTLTSLVLRTLAISRLVSSASNLRAMISCSRFGELRARGARGRARRSLWRRVSSGPRGWPCDLLLDMPLPARRVAAGFSFRQWEETSLRAIVKSQEPNESGGAEGLLLHEGLLEDVGDDVQGDFLVLDASVDVREDLGEVVVVEV